MEKPGLFLYNRTCPRMTKQKGERAMSILANGRLITRDPALGYLRDGGVVIQGRTILDRGTTAELRAKYPAAEFLDARGGVIMPAFINAHTHI